MSCVHVLNVRDCNTLIFWLHFSCASVAGYDRCKRYLERVTLSRFHCDTQTKSFYMSVKMAQVFRCTLRRAILGNDAIFLWHFREPNCRCYWWGESSLGRVCTRRGSDGRLTQPQLLVQRSYINTTRPGEDKVGHSLHNWTSASPHFLLILTCILCIHHSRCCDVVIMYCYK